MQNAKWPVILHVEAEEFNMKEAYQYRRREVAKNPAKEFRLGEGRISGYLSVTLGVLSLLAVLAYLYPSYLTLPFSSTLQL